VTLGRTKVVHVEHQREFDWAQQHLGLFLEIFCACACARVCVRARAYVCVCVCARACMRARACECTHVHARARTCLLARSLAHTWQHHYRISPSCFYLRRLACDCTHGTGRWTVSINHAPPRAHPLTPLSLLTTRIPRVRGGLRTVYVLVCKGLRISTAR
jgi:hypothetical protein